jgi:hypothetical protein
MQFAVFADWMLSLADNQSESESELYIGPRED